MKRNTVPDDALNEILASLNYENPLLMTAMAHAIREYAERGIWPTNPTVQSEMVNYYELIDLSRLGEKLTQ